MKGLVVYLHGVRVGVLSDSDEPSFSYDAGWLATPSAYPLSRQLPLRGEAFSGQVVRGYFSGLLPEAEPRERIAAILGISSGNDFAMLERIGGDCAGAVSLLPEEIPPPKSGSGQLRWLAPEELADIVSGLPQRPLMAGEDGPRLSLAGAQIKLPVVAGETSDKGGLRISLPLGDLPSTHILKPEPTRFPGLVTNEAWCLALARQVGLDAVEARTLTVGTTPCLLVKRYDRLQTGDAGAQRLHQEDFCQALGLPPTRKYQQEGGPSLRDCFGLIREWSSAPVLDILAFLDAVAFAALIGNADAHAKNFSFLYAGGSRRMAPLYDQVCTLAWPELSKGLSMKIGTARSLAEVSPEHFRQLSAETKLGWPMVRDRLSDLCAKVKDAIRQGDVSGTEKASLPPSLVLPRAERMLDLLNG